MNDSVPNKRLFLGFGDIAQRTARLSQSKNIPVTAMRRTKMSVSDVNLLQGDVTRTEDLKRCLDEGTWDIALILTASEYTEQGYRDSYLAAANALARVLPTHSPSSRVIFVSSTSVYGQNAGEWVDESSLCEPKSATAKVLLEAETSIAELDNQSCNLRFSGIYGRGRHRLIERIKSGTAPSTDSIHWTNRIHSEDCAGVIDHLLCASELPPVMLATDSAPSPRHQVQAFIATALGVSEGVEPEVSDREKMTGKRCKNDLLKAMGYRLRYEDYRQGFAELIATEHK